MPEKTKILYLITQSELGGAQRYVFDLANNLKNEYDITVAYGEPGNAGALAKVLHDNNIPAFFLRHLKRRISPINDLLACIEIIKLIKIIQPDFVHLNSSKISILGTLAFLWSRPKTKKAKLIYTVHDWVFNEPLPRWQADFYFWVEKITARWKDKLICVSEHDRQTAIDDNIAPADKLITIHNGIPPVAFMTKLDAQRILIDEFKFNNKLDGIIIGSIGNLYKTKGYEYLIRSLKILADKNIKFKMIIMGDGQERRYLHSLAKENGLTDRIFFSGQISSAARLLPAVNVYVNSSVKEGLSYTVIEAMQAGLPIVATDVGGNAELIADGETGLIAKPADIFSLADMLEKICLNYNLGAKLGAQARQKALTEFTLTTMIEKTKQVYK